MDEVGIDVGAKVIEHKQYYGNRMEFPNIDAIDFLLRMAASVKKYPAVFICIRMENRSKKRAKVVTKIFFIHQKPNPKSRRQRAENISKDLFAFANEAADG